MELTKEQANRLINQAYQLLSDAHHGYYKNADTNDNAEIDDRLVDALDSLEEIQ